MGKIKNIKAIECLDSRGYPTVYVEVQLDNDVIGSAFVPSGASTGEHEALELRDQDQKRYLGKGVLKAVNNINTTIAKTINGFDVTDINKIDNTLINLDGTETKSKLGANAILGVSLACCKAAAQFKKIPLFKFFAELFGANGSCYLPVPLINVINGGAHANNSVDFQEFMIVPHLTSSFSDNIKAACEVFQTLKKNLNQARLSTGVGDEGGFAPNLKSSGEAIELLLNSITDAGYTPGKDFSLALDVAASELYDRNQACYVLKKSTGEKLKSIELIEFYQELIKKYPIVSIEDGLDENDWNGWKLLTEKLGNKVQLIGDDLFVTNKNRLEQGINKKIANSVLIKLNQIGTVSETLDCIKLAYDNSYTAVISHRSGETEDTCIADLAVAVNSKQIKTGSVCRGERTAKYNRLLWIENYLGSAAKYINPFNV